MLMSDDDPAAVSSYNNTTDSLEAISVALAAGTGCTTAIEADQLDHLGAAACADTSDPVDMTAEVADNSILANILDDGGDTSAYDRRTHSLFAIANKQPKIAETSSVAMTSGSVANVFTITGGYIGCNCEENATVIFGTSNVEYNTGKGLHAFSRGYIKADSVTCQNNSTNYSPAVNTVGNEEGYIDT